MTTSMISLADVVHLHREKNNQISMLQDISLEVAKYSSVALMGDSIQALGAILRCINLSDKPKSGTIIIDNTKINSLDKDEINKVKNQISLIPANPSLLSSKTVWQNVALPLELNKISKAEIQTRVEASLALTGLTKIQHSSVDLLSNLDKCRVALARGLVNNPQVLLLDNATQILDVKSATKYINLLQVVKNKLNLTIIFATNNLELAKSLCQQVIIVSAGKIVEVTTPSEISLQPGSLIAKELVKNHARHELPYVIKRKLALEPLKNSNPIARIAFQEDILPEAILNKLIETTGIKLNILQAYQEVIIDEKISIIMAEMICDGKNLDVIKTYLEDHKLYMEILGYV